MIKGKGPLIEYYNKKNVASTYDNKRFTNTFGKLQHEMEVRIINRVVSKFKNPKLLEIAVGTGRITKDIKATGIGIDTSQNMLDIAKKRVPGWKFIKMSIIHLTFKEKFNVIVSIRLLRHFNKKDRKIALKKICKALSPNGLLIFDMPTERHNKILDLISNLKKTDNIYEADTTVEKIKKELNASGFQIMKVYNTKNENLIFKAMCLINDKSDLLYPLLKNYMKKYLNKLRLATNVLVVAKKIT